MSSNIPDFEALLVPMQLDAFVLNPAVCGTGTQDDTTAHICPITQPNYTFLRLDSFVIQSDVQNHADVHNTAPASINPRLTDLGGLPEPKPLRHRHGVYIHWTLPRVYRSGVSSGEEVPESRRRYERARRGLKAAAPRSGQDGTGANDTPDFVDPPTRWIVVRKLDVESIQPAEAKTDFADREYEAWVVQSDYLWSLEDIPLDLDLQTDLAPFVTGHAGGDIKIEEQAEVFIGRKTPLADWSGQEDPNAQPPSISLLRSGNQLFADFQMHNSNVFSVLDNFEYGSPKDPKYLSYAKASYYVFGWHWKEGEDPLWESGETVAHGASLDSLFMSLKGLSDGADDPWLEAKSQLRILCHGAMYDVTWDHENKPKEVPADQYNARLRDQVQAAVSVGTTPMDSLLTYCHARRDQSDRPGDIEKLEEDILALESLLLARDDGVEGQREAKDSIYNWSFARSPGGTRYFFSEPESSDQGGPKQPLEPDTESKLKLRELNQTQRLLDACNMTVTQYRWDMFSVWWKYFSDLQKQDSGNQDTNRDAATLSSRITALDSRIKELQQRVDNLLHPTDGSANLLEKANTASEPVFYHANDPTVLIGGIPSGWPDDYLEKVSVRGPFQVISPKDDEKLPDALNKLCSLVQNKVPAVFQMPAAGLVAEFYLLRPGGDGSGTPPEGKFFPQFHDQLNADERWRDQWGDRQPWFPLFAEWEVEYRHIPFDYWKLDEHTARLSADELVRYGISVPPKDGKTPPLWEAILKDQIAGQADTRVLSGRVLILPQPSFSLGAKIMQLFQNTPPDILDQYLAEADRNNLLTNITQLSYLSSPLSGMTSGIVTQAEGSHIKPENKVIDPQGGESSAVLDAAVITAAGLTADRIKLIQGNSALTPFSTLTNFGDNEYCPFKPVTHGQFRFRKFNIIDKFGQALVAIDQKPRPEGPPPIYPCISDFYEPQTVKLDDGKTYANTVIQENSDQCEFLQVPPQINQNVRLNSDFVKRIADDPPEERKRFKTGISPDSAKWRPATEWEMPIWGWVITNYADYGIQLFLPDGTFYREVRFGGPLGALQSPKWLPFSPKDTPPTPDTRQLDALVDKLVDPEYLRGFWFMVTTAQDKLPPAPSAYAQFLNSIVGKPLALVNTGWSLELDGPPLQIQSKEGKVNEPERLLTPPTDDKKPFYQFQVRLGNRDAGYDGLVGYFDTTTPGSDELNLDAIRTFFAPEKDDMKPLKRLDTTSYPLFTPFWEQPMPVDGSSQSIEPGNFVDQRNARMSIYGAIVDPFTPVHAYSSILPPIPLSLPPWTWQKAMDTMTAFFHAGPLTLPINDVPSYDESQKLTTQNARDIPKRDLPLPSLSAGDWSWFQPYAEPQSTVAGEGDAEQATYNPFGIEKRGDLNKPAFQDGPYVAIEGFLQLRNPVMMPKGS
ncbi:hypothetical protein CDD81_5963 [Ophiocordyceps australis]|uniref:Uncharacterized protein n=1 Tax=Ophiocordyceps australis TaxID=1399860 RepID=A0A2C5YIV5_9HYPO|nr:hypothetical protein CDD81_5963 [Ophiocordyceps australis]